MRTETRAAQLEVRDRMISGVAIPWGQRARVVTPAGERVTETFVRGSVRNTGRPVPLLLDHGGAEVGRLTPQSTDRGLEVRGEYSGDLGPRSRFSVEFNALAETRSEDLRIIHDARLQAVAAVEHPAYEGAAIEARNLNLRGSYRTTIRPDRAMDCRCSGSIPGKTHDVVASIRFEREAWEPMMEAIRTETRDVLAISRGAGDVVATTGTGTLGLSVAAGGALAISVAPLDTAAGRGVRELVEAGVEVYARPVIDFSESEFEVEGDTAVIRRADFAFILLKPTDRAHGLEPLRKAREGRKGLTDKRRRLLLVGAA